MSMLSTRDLAQYEEEGYLLLRAAFAQERVEALRLARRAFDWRRPAAPGAPCRARPRPAGYPPLQPSPAP